MQRVLLCMRQSAAQGLFSLCTGSFNCTSCSNRRAGFCSAQACLALLYALLLCCVCCWCAVEIVNSTFEDNGGEVGGGALAASESSSVTVKQCRFERNGISGYSNVQKALGNRGTQASLMQGGAVLVKDNAKGGHDMPQRCS